jgi:hypothetical protein
VRTIANDTKRKSWFNSSFKLILFFFFLIMALILQNPSTF